MGATPGGLQAALTLARFGAEVTLIDGGREISRVPRRWGEDARRWHRHLLKEVSYHPRIRIETETEVAELREGLDGVEVLLKQGPRWVLPTACVDCEKCLPACPVELTDGQRPIFRVAAPTTLVIDKRQKPPCRSACPLDMNVQGYTALIAQGRLEEAYDLILDTNPLPAICGRVCHHPCERACRRQELDEPIAICALKRFAADAARESDAKRRGPEIAPGAGPRVAVVGSGPAGLTAAHDLAKAGFRPMVIEADSAPGGLLRRGIASYRLPRAVLDEEIERILGLGVELRLNAPVERWADLERLKAEGFQAVLLTTGASQDRLLKIPGEDLAGVHGCVVFLRELWEGRGLEPLGRVVVVGGGNAAVEAARASLRFGARSVTLVYRRRRREMPADPHEVEEAVEEGVRLRCLTLPIGFEGKGGRLARVRCIKMRLAEPDSSGRPTPVPVGGSDFLIPADTAIVSIGQGADPSYAAGGKLRLSRWGTILVSESGATHAAGIYAAGDVVSGPSTVVEAMASGRKAARAIMESLGAAQSRSAPQEAAGLQELPAVPRDAPRRARRALPHRPVAERIYDLEEVAGPLSREDAQQEAARCLQCGVCSECRRCEAACELGAIDHDRIETSRRLGFERIVVADETQMIPELQSSRVIRLPLARSAGLMRSSAAGRVGAMDAVAAPPPPAPQAASPQAPRDGVPRTAVFVCSCNGALNERGEVDELLAALEGTPGVVHLEGLLAACHPEQGRRIEQVWREKRLSAALVASCTCCHLDFVCESCTDQRIRLKHRLFGEAGFARQDIGLVNIKETCLVPFREDPRAAAGLGALGIRAGLRQLGERRTLSLERRVHDSRAVVLGATEAGLAAARGLAGRLPSVVLVAEGEVEPGVRAELAECGVELVQGARPVRLEGQWGAFTVSVEKLEAAPGAGGQRQAFSAGTIILGRGDFGKMRYQRDPFTRPRRLPTQPGLGSLETGVPGVFVASWSQAAKIPREALGRAAASEALEGIWGRVAPRSEMVARVESEICRGCGRCAEICPEGAARLEATARGAATSWIDAGLCTACGSCAAECPTGAVRMPEADQAYFERVMDVLLG